MLHDFVKNLETIVKGLQFKQEQLNLLLLFGGWGEGAKFKTCWACIEKEWTPFLVWDCVIINFRSDMTKLKKEKDMKKLKMKNLLQLK